MRSMRSTASEKTRDRRDRAFGIAFARWVSFHPVASVVADAVDDDGVGAFDGWTDRPGAPRGAIRSLDMVSSLRPPSSGGSASRSVCPRLTSREP